MNEKQYYYEAHGLVIKSVFKLPDFFDIEEKDEYDLEITAGHHLRSKLPAEWFIKKIDHKILIYFREVGLFEVDEKRITFLSDRGTLTKFSHLYLSGLVIGAFLLKKENIVLHASAVANEAGKVTLFVGKSGAGKSCVVAGLLSKGFRLLSDDMVVLKSNENEVDGSTVARGKIRLQLKPDIFSMLYTEDVMTGKNIIKNKLFVTPPSLATSGKLAAIYLLETGDKPSIQEVTKSEALFGLMQNDMQSRFFGNDHRQLDNLAKLVEGLPIYKFIRTEQFSDYETGINLLFSHMEEINLTERGRT